MVALAAVVNGVGSGGFFPANMSAVMKAAPGRQFGVASGMLRTFANVGMVFSFAVAILVSARSIPRGLAFAIFVGTTHLSRELAGTFTTCLHAALLSSAGIMVIAAGLSATRVLRRPAGPRSLPEARPGAPPSVNRGVGA